MPQLDAMRLAITAIAITLATPLGAATDLTPTSLQLSGPTIVVLRASGAEIAKTTPDEKLTEFRTDFEGTTKRLMSALKAHPEVKVVVSSADVIRFTGTQTPPVWRYSLDAGYGYVFYQPGSPVRVFSGVRTADGLFCEASRMFALKPRPPNCDP